MNWVVLSASSEQSPRVLSRNLMVPSLHVGRGCADPNFFPLGCAVSHVINIPWGQTTIHLHMVGGHDALTYCRDHSCQQLIGEFTLWSPVYRLTSGEILTLDLFQSIGFMECACISVNRTLFRLGTFCLHNYQWMKTAMFLYCLILWAKWTWIRSGGPVKRVLGHPSLFVLRKHLRARSPLLS